MKDADESDRIETLPDRPQSPHPNYVTPSGLRQLESQVAELTNRRRELACQDTLDSRQQLSIVERDLRYFEERVKRAILVESENQPADRVHFGARVRVRDEQDAESWFVIVGEDEADAARGLISWVSPLASALLNRVVGESVIWRRPAGDKELEILDVVRASEH